MANLKIRRIHWIHGIQQNSRSKFHRPIIEIFLIHFRKNRKKLKTSNNFDTIPKFELTSNNFGEELIHNRFHHPFKEKFQFLMHMPIWLWIPTHEHLWSRQTNKRSIYSLSAISAVYSDVQTWAPPITNPVRNREIPKWNGLVPNVMHIHPACKQFRLTSIFSEDSLLSQSWNH